MEKESQKELMKRVLFEAAKIDLKDNWTEADKEDFELAETLAAPMVDAMEKLGIKLAKI